MQRLGEKGLIWLKRDLRVRDHAPLAAGLTLSASTALFVLEPAWLASPECAPQHVDFVRASLRELKRNLSPLGITLLVREGEATAVLADLLSEQNFTHLLSHEETGTGWSFERDIAVGQWCKRHAIEWREYPQTGVVRRLKTRLGWARRWAARMDSPAVALSNLPPFASALQVSAVPEAEFDHATSTRQVAGEAAAWEVLHSFLAGRGSNYRRAMSSPLQAWGGCSRLSPHLAFGTISMRSVHLATEAAIKEYLAMGERGFAYALRGFSGRLRWHCHFMQKLEDEPAIEFQNFSRSADGLRRKVYGTEDTRRFDAWCAGQTGYPMVDACMRALLATGWLNFRMRALLVSFASYHLWLDWRQTGIHLARQFLDFEPGIHWSQMQMQSGTTGINTLRIYSPTKQAKDQDPDGVFIRHWCPELANVPLPLLAEPWKMTQAQQLAAGCVIGHDYPAPVVEEKAALQFAKDTLYGIRKTESARLESKAIQNKHGSRKGGLPPTQKNSKSNKTKAASPQPLENPQGTLF